MTPVDQRLDPAVLFHHETLHLYRLTKAKYVTLSGIGAALAPGRWNAAGEEAIYTSSQQAGTVLECLVHTPKEKLPSDLALVTLKLTGMWRFHASTESAYAYETAQLSALASLREARTAASTPLHPVTRSFAVAVPSVIVPIWNVVLYPARPGFWKHVAIENVEPFTYDPRLFPATAEAMF